MDSLPRLKLTGLNKRFGESQVLHSVDLTLSSGEIHGLAGQNGSGKSTLIKILTGVYTPDPGASLEVDGRPIRLPVRWDEIHRAGVSVVHQDLGVLDGLTVAENVCVGGFPRSRWLRAIDRQRRDELCANTLARVGCSVAPSTLAADLTAAQRAEVAIARAIRDHTAGAGLLILDEATRALTGEELSHVHDLLRRIAAEGSCVLMISHNLLELAALANRVSVIRDGKLVAAGLPMPESGPEEIARYMLGSTLSAHPATEKRRSEGSEPAPIARINGLATDRIEEMTLDLAAGEIVGITGIPGSGYEEIPYVLTGARRALRGSMEVGGTSLDLARSSPAQCIAAGVMLIPERRDRDGLALEMSVRDNMSLPALHHHGRKWYLGKKWQQRRFVEYTSALGIKSGGPMSLVRELSGGNQQKTLLAKWLGVKPKVLVLHEPTQAVDVGARRDIWTTLQKVAHDGVAIVLVSSEPEDLTSICTRVMIHTPGSGLATARSSTSDALIDEIYSRNDRVVGATSET